MNTEATIVNDNSFASGDSGNVGKIVETDVNKFDYDADQQLRASDDHTGSKDIDVTTNLKETERESESETSSEGFEDAFDDLNMETEKQGFEDGNRNQGSEGYSNVGQRRSGNEGLIGDGRENLADDQKCGREAALDDDDPYAPSEDERFDPDVPEDEQLDGGIVIDEAMMREKESCMTDEEKQLRRDEARRLKDIGNEQYKEGQYQPALESYTDALATCLLCHNEDRSIIYSNRAATMMKLSKFDGAIEDCTKALELKPDYMKALLRRAELYEKTDKLDEALVDYQKVLERDPSLHQARAACMRIPDQITERNEKMKEEMLGKLKDLGNMILRPFGLSTNNFKMQQDPTSGSYSVSFQQNSASS